MLQPEILQVPVDGGNLTVARWGSGPHVVLAPHGITANHVGWAHLAEELHDEVTLLAPDLRGRGDSATLPGPYGMAAHARDLIAVLDHVGGDRALMVGHSMGGFVAVKAAINHPDRLTGIVLLDGGLPLPVPEGMDIDVILQAVIGPAMERLSLTFPSPEAYHDYWRPHPAVGPAWDKVVEAYLDHDIHEVDGAWRSKVDIDAIRADGRDTLEDTTLLTGFATIDLPRWFVWSPRGVMDADPLYPREVVDAVSAANPNLTVVDLQDVNHYTLLLSRQGAAQVATVVRDALTS